ncbi:PREDICTED: uncharacterized protein At3g50808-like [Tarenaya hassleriana]|uniref:uncharacterized protein At3g50808-like n=1 Tax=Tarenaya hassleriana TaxID=28532 RepID=UPI00053C9883|nr:PREDICTED: uncharacterized protein At3g50808-like [Tarenaya hassleriana]
MARKPAWLEGLMAETFFASCGVHEGWSHKNEKNVFCLTCCVSLCPHCVPFHQSHPLLQVRRYMYQDVVLLSDLENFIDCSYIKPYTLNGAKVIYLNQRAQTSAVSSNVCRHCYKVIQEPFHFCSLSCKVDHLISQYADLSSIILYRLDDDDDGNSERKGSRRKGVPHRAPFY